MEHELKCWPSYFRHILDGRKRFEVRRDDRGFQVGDTLRLQEWEPRDPETMPQTTSASTPRGYYSGRELRVKVTSAVDDSFPGVRSGYVVLGIEPLNAPPRPRVSLERGAQRLYAMMREPGAIEWPQVPESVRRQWREATRAVLREAGVGVEG